MRAPGRDLRLRLQQIDGYVPPVWPEQPGQPQQQMHLDFHVSDLRVAGEHALRCGAAEADKQFSDQWHVYRDPQGHPFCLCL